MNKKSNKNIDLDQEREMFEDYIAKVSSKLEDLCGDFMKKIILDSDKDSYFGISAIMSFFSYYISSTIACSTSEDKDKDIETISESFKKHVQIHVKQFMGVLNEGAYH